MPRGEETQVPPQEEGEASREVQETKPEAQRDAEVVAEPEAVIERERPVEESEAIEAAVVEAVEAVESVTEDRRPETGDGDIVDTTEVAVSLDETSFKVESPAPEWEEEPPKPPQGTMEDGGRKTEDGDSAVSLNETSFKVESQAEVEEVILDEASFKVETLTPDQEVGEEIMDDVSYKLNTPLPDQDIGEVEVQDTVSEEVLEEETGEILDADSFKPVPAQEGAEEIEHEDHWSTEEDGVEEKGGLILIGEEEGELEQIDLTAEAVKEVEEYWEPPEMYEYRTPDGTMIIIDANGDPVDWPPQNLSKDLESGGNLQGWYDGSQNPQAFEIPPWPGFNQDKIYIKLDSGAIDYVDKDGISISAQVFLDNTFNYDQNGNIESYTDKTGKTIKFELYDSVKHSILIYSAPDGTKTLVHSDGTAIKCPPLIKGGGDGGYGYENSQGKFIELKEYQPPVPKNVFVYIAKDGTKSFVDNDGNPLKYPPKLVTDPNDETGFGYTSSDGSFASINEYKPGTDDVFVYRVSDGTVTIVDIHGNPVKSPPDFWNSFDNEGDIVAKDPSGKEVTLKEYQQPYDGLFVYTAKDGAKTVVDCFGTPVKSPPQVWNQWDGEGTYTKSPDGKEIELKEYIPPVTDIFVYVAKDGTRTVVDKNGDPVKTPPDTMWDNDYQDVVAVGPDGKKVVLAFYKPETSQEHGEKLFKEMLLYAEKNNPS